MSRNGNGVYSLPAGNPAVTGTVISSSVQNTTLSDIATALTASIAADGQTPITADIPMNSHKLTGLAAATTNGDALVYTSGTYTGTITGCTTSPTVTVKWSKIGNLVHIQVPPLLAAPTSNATTFTITGGPADIVTTYNRAMGPSVPQPPMATILATNNSATATVQVYVDNASTIIFSAIGLAAGTGWANSGTKSYGIGFIGLGAGCEFSYLL